MANNSNLKRLNSILEKTEEKIENREFTYEERTEKWQDSSKGSFRELLEEFKSNLEMTIESLESFLNS